MPCSAVCTARAPGAFAAVTGVKLTTAPLTPAGRTAAPSAIPPRVPRFRRACRDSAALPGTGFVARRLHRSPTRMEDRMYDDQSKNGARERTPQTTTTDSGIPAASDEHSLTVGPDGPIVLHDHYLVQKMQAFNRERVPERVVHA